MSFRKFISQISSDFYRFRGISDPDMVSKLKQLPYPLDIRISHHDTDKVFVHGFLMDKP